MSNERLQEACRHFLLGVSKCLRSRSVAPAYIDMDLDIWRSMTGGKGMESNHSGHKLYQLEDFSQVKYLPENWWYHINEKGSGLAVDFPLKAKPILSWSSTTYMKKDGKFVKAPKTPVEKICLTIIRRACSANTL